MRANRHKALRIVREMARKRDLTLSRFKMIHEPTDSFGPEWCATVPRRPGARVLVCGGVSDEPDTAKAQFPGSEFISVDGSVYAVDFLRC